MLHFPSIHYTLQPKGRSTGVADLQRSDLQMVYSLKFKGMIISFAVSVAFNHCL